MASKKASASRSSDRWERRIFSKPIASHECLGDEFDVHSQSVGSHERYDDGAEAS